MVFNGYKIMKYLVILTIILSSCTTEIKEYDWQIPVEINTKQDAFDHIVTYDYVPKYEVFTPDQLYYQGYGDCRDFSLMFQYLLETQLGINADVIIGDCFDSKHAWVEDGENIYETTAGIINNLPELYNGRYKYKYPESVLMVQSYHGFLQDKEYKY